MNVGFSPCGMFRSNEDPFRILFSPAITAADTNPQQSSIESSLHRDSLAKAVSKQE
jgi:hypothetical protein